MKLWIKTLFVFLFFYLIFLPKNIEAHSGRTDSSGCHNCYTSECYGEYHCHNEGTGGGYQPPPSCPSMSSYNSLSGQCECYSGYVASGNSCISIDQSCKNIYGYNSERDYSTNKCKCRYGYVWNSAGTKCISEDESCQNEFGYNSKATISGNQCECKYGYVWNSTQTKCIDDDQACRDKYGYNSKASLSGDKCECKYGYVWNQAVTKCVTKDVACQELNGIMSRSNLSGECECLSGYEYDGSECVSSKKEIMVDEINTPTIKTSRTIEPTKKPTSTIVPSETLSPKIKSDLSSLDTNKKDISIGGFLIKLFFGCLNNFNIS